MEKDTKRISPANLQKDAYTLNAVQGIAGYAPARQELALNKLLALNAAMQAAQRTEVQKEGEAKAARDNAVKAEHTLHDALLAVKDQIRAQFGASSDEYQSIGLKKKTEYKPRTRKTA